MAHSPSSSRITVPASVTHSSHGTAPTSDPQSKMESSAFPALRERDKAATHVFCHCNCSCRMIGSEDWVVEVDHQTVTLKTAESSFVSCDMFAHFVVVLPEH